MIFFYFRFSIVPQILASKMTSESDNPNNVEADFVIDQRKTDWVQSFFRHMPRSQVSVFELFSFKDDLETSEASVISDQNFSTTDDLEEVFFSTTNARIVNVEEEEGEVEEEVEVEEEEQQEQQQQQQDQPEVQQVQEVMLSNRGIGILLGGRETTSLAKELEEGFGVIIEMMDRGRSGGCNRRVRVKPKGLGGDVKQAVNVMFVKITDLAGRGLPFPAIRR